LYFEVEGNESYFDIVSLVIVTAFTEKSMMNDTMDIQLIEKRITVLEGKSVIMW